MDCKLKSQGKVQASSRIGSGTIFGYLGLKEIEWYQMIHETHNQKNHDDNDNDTYGPYGGKL